MDLKSRIIDFLTDRNPKLCAFSSASISGKPECAVMGYAVRSDLSLVLSTDKNSRKVINIKENSQVALSFGWTFEELNVQYEGIATGIANGPEMLACEKIYFASHPESMEFKGAPETVYISITPSWLRLSDYTTTPPSIEEKMF